MQHSPLTLDRMIADLDKSDMDCQREAAQVIRGVLGSETSPMIVQHVDVENAGSLLLRRLSSTSPEEREEARLLVLSLPPYTVLSAVMHYLLAKAALGWTSASPCSIYHIIRAIDRAGFGI